MGWDTGARGGPDGDGNAGACHGMGEKGVLEVGRDADLVVLSPQLYVQRTFCRGASVFSLSSRAGEARQGTSRCHRRAIRRRNRGLQLGSTSHGGVAGAARDDNSCVARSWDAGLCPFLDSQTQAPQRASLHHNCERNGSINSSVTRSQSERFLNCSSVYCLERFRSLSNIASIRLPNSRS